MRKAIVSTTIHEPTEALRRFAAMPGWQLVVVLDRKEVRERLPGVVYLEPHHQEQISPELSELIGWGSIQRRNFGFIYAHNTLQADLVATVDDDNVPLSNWGDRIYAGTTLSTGVFKEPLPAFDPLGQTEYGNLWHRGYPLQLVGLRRKLYETSREAFFVGIQEDAVDGDPDVDAICRMIHRPDCRFESSVFPIAADKIAPFNSQNTFIHRSVLPDYFCFPHVGRMDDIWGAYHAQAMGHRVVFGPPTVRQDRHAHDLVADMRAEYLGYENNLDIVREINGGSSSAVLDRLPDRSRRAFEVYRGLFR